MHYSDPGAYSDVKTRLRRAYGDPRAVESGDARFRNPITSLWMDDLANGTGKIILVEITPWGRANDAQSAQERPTELTGCHDITARDLLTDDKVGSGFEDEIPRRIEFAGPFRGWDASDTLRTEIVVPEGALPSVHSIMAGQIVGDSLHVGFSTGYGGVSAVLGWTGDRWVGSAQTSVDVGPPFEFDAGPIEITPVSCDSPPPVPVDVMLPIARSVELEGGLVITLGEPLPEALGTSAGRGSLTNVTGRATGLLAGTDSIAVRVVERWGVTQIRLHYTDPGAYSSVETRLRRAYGVPEEDEWGARFSNPITSLMLTDLPDGAGEVFLSFR